MQSKAKTVAAYLAELPDDRRKALETVRAVILKNLDKDCEEGMQYGMIGYYVPHSVFPDGYHCDPKQPLPYAGMASQKNHMSLYLFCAYTSPEHKKWFEQAWLKTGKKLDMGKACVRFKKAEDLALDVLGEAVRRVSASTHIKHYQAALGTMKNASEARKAAKAPAKKKPAARKATGKSASTKKTSKKVSRKKTPRSR